jgi:outer membrane protein, multidrug efflux system
MACGSNRVLATALITLLGACTLEPHYQRPPSPVPALEARAAGGTAAADIGWREFFPDPQLQQLIALTLANNRDLRVAALNVQSAQAQYRIQRAQLFPTIDASAVEQIQRVPIDVLEAEVPAGSNATSRALPSGITVHTYDVGVGFTSY